MAPIAAVLTDRETFWPRRKTFPGLDAALYLGSIVLQQSLDDWSQTCAGVIERAS